MPGVPERLGPAAWMGLQITITLLVATPRGQHTGWCQHTGVGVSTLVGVSALVGVSTLGLVSAQWMVSAHGLVSAHWLVSAASQQSWDQQFDDPEDRTDEHQSDNQQFDDPGDRTDDPQSADNSLVTSSLTTQQIGLVTHNQQTSISWREVWRPRRYD